MKNTNLILTNIVNTNTKTFVLNMCFTHNVQRCFSLTTLWDNSPQNGKGNLSLFTQPHVVSIPYDCLSAAEQKWRFFQDAFLHVWRTHSRPTEENQ